MTCPLCDQPATYEVYFHSGVFADEPTPEVVIGRYCERHADALSDAQPLVRPITHDGPPSGAPSGNHSR
jgi:hypothetical protein